MSYVKPQDVTAPKTEWQLDRVIYDGGPDDVSWAIGYWDGDRRIVTRWNGNDASPTGMPYRRAYPTWFVVDPGAYKTLFGYLAFLNPGQAAYIKEFLFPSHEQKAA